MTSTTATNILQPLKATPAPSYSYWREEGENSGSEGSNEHSPTQSGTCIDDDELKNYECAVCFEIMDTPVGCGSCQTRFCRPCLEHVAKQGGARPMCSHCRSPFTLESIQVDEALQEEMKNCMETVLCPFRGCGKKIPINAIKLHVVQCDHIKMKCKFSEWGCEWIGKKKDLEHHDNNECEFRNGMGRLVNAIREKTFSQSETIIRMQGTSINQAVDRNTRHMLMARGRNAGNIFDVLAMSYEAVCFPGRFAASKEIWGDMINQVNSRSLVFNVLLVFPIFLCMGKLPLLMAFSLSNEVSPRGIRRLGPLGLLREFDEEIIALSSTLIALLCMMYDGTGDGTRWARMRMPGTNKSYPFMRDFSAVFIFFACKVFVSFMDLWPGIALLLCTLSFTVSFSSCVAAILEKVSGSQADTLKICKMWPIIVFALRYSFLHQVCLFSQALKGVIFLRLARHASVKHLNANFTLEETECFFSAIPPSIYVAIGVAMTAMDIKNGVVKDWMTAVNAWLVGPCFVACFNLLTYVFYWFGQASGDSIYEEGKRNERIQSNNLLPSRRPVFTGVVITFLALFYVVFIVCV
mmetsp:Transcript_4765/g.8099  ORF Transcript_4765/g.8099 Transcript_4765/m.8099 type:complete len:579 (+) Transcript_4765:200-1936(+)